MAGSNRVFEKGYISTGTLATLYLPVKLSGTAGTNCTAPTAVTDKLLGIAQEICLAADAGKRVVNVMRMGISLVVAKGTITAGDPLKLDGTFTGFVTATVAGTDIVQGYAEESGVSGDQIHMFFVIAAKL